jgi:hypothetical protein
VNSFMFCSHRAILLVPPACRRIFLIFIRKDWGSSIDLYTYCLH